MEKHLLLKTSEPFVSWLVVSLAKLSLIGPRDERTFLWRVVEAIET